MKKILYVGYRDKRHSSAGGYDHIINNPEADSLMGENVPFGFIPVCTRGKCLNEIALDMIARTKRKSYDVVHYFYGDHLFLPYRRNSSHKVVATIHLRVDESNKMFIRTLKSLDGIVVLSKSQKLLLKEKFNLESVFIPHGFNRPIFNKVGHDINLNFLNICVLGKNYRDYDTLETVVSFCHETRPDIRFHLIGQSLSIKKKFSLYSNVVLYPHIDDDYYFSIIDSCDYSFLPLTFATANNALLEAGFLGVTSILPNIPGVEDYGAPSPLNLYYSNVDEVMHLFQKLVKTTKSRELIDFCESNFLWNSVYIKLNLYYKSLFYR